MPDPVAPPAPAPPLAPSRPRPPVWVRSGAAARPDEAPWRLLLGACVALAALSLLGPSSPTYDPWAWIIWGREITEGALDTRDGPSWKPLPVLFTTPFALAGDDAAPGLWLVVARAGGLLAIAMCFRLAARLAGPWAGVVAAAGLALAEDFVRHCARGNSEGLLVALALWAIERHLDGRRTQAFALGLGAALLRPEVWPFWGLYGLWLAVRDPRARALVVAAFAAVPLLWFVPEWIGSGDPLRAAHRAMQPNLDSPAFADRPFLAVFDRAGELLLLPVLLGAALGALHAAHRRERTMLALAGATVVLMVGVGLMTEAGFAGNVRYVLLPAALACVLAGAGWAALVRAAGPRLAPVAALVAAALAAPFLLEGVDDLRAQLRGVRAEARSVADLDHAIARAGGPARINGCESVYTTRFQVQLVAYKLHRHGREVEIFVFPPGYAIAPRRSALARDPRFERVARTAIWSIARRCPG